MSALSTAARVDWGRMIEQIPSSDAVTPAQPRGVAKTAAVGVRLILFLLMEKLLTLTYVRQGQQITRCKESAILILLSPQQYDR